MPADRAASFLQMIRRSQRGRLKIYLGFAPGVGKTFQMLQEGHRLKSENVDIVVGLVEHHGREQTKQLIGGLEQMALRQVEYHGIRVEEMDIDAILARRPQVCLVDELAHTNVPGSRNQKRYEDVLELIAVGIHVISTLNVQHLESLYDTVERLIGVKVRERIPDSVLAEADQVVNVDLAADDLQKRLREGKIYPKERVAASLQNFFTESNLEHLRELTLRELAGQLDYRRREAMSVGTNDGTFTSSDAGVGTSDQIMVCLSSRGPNSARLLRFGSRLAGRLNRNWYAVYVQTPEEEPTVIDAATHRLLADTLTLANELGATVFTFKGSDVPETILRFAQEYRVGQIVIGSPHPIPWYKRVLLGRRSVAEDLIMRQKGVTVIVIDADASENLTKAGASDSRGTAGLITPIARRSSASKAAKPDLASMLSPDRVLLFDEPINLRQLIEGLVSAAIAGRSDAPASELIMRLIDEREARGSTFLNEGIALPHARVPGLSEPAIALAVIRGGVLDAPTDSSLDVAFLLLAPDADPAAHLRVMAAAGRVLGERERRRAMLAAASSQGVIDALT